MVDDGSTDNSKAVVSAFKDNRIKYFYQENQERSSARNHGLQNVQGKYICFLDDDDYFSPKHLEILHSNILENGANTIYKVGAILKNEKTEYKEASINILDLTPVEYIIQNGISLFQLCFPKNIQQFQFDTKIKYGEDLKFALLCILNNYKLIEIDVHSVVINDHSNRSSNSNTCTTLVSNYHDLKSVLVWARSSGLSSNTITKKLRKEKLKVTKRLLKEACPKQIFKLWMT